jgi:CheY-like chemotaxis protein
VALILTNLLSNAHKYTPHGGQIDVVARRDGDRVRVDVRDSGIGMTPEEQAKLFTRFFRADNTMTAEEGGTGLGLVITRSLIEMHGGEITVRSAPGKGSTFSFTLPTTHKLTERPMRVAPEVGAAMRARSGKRILVVDDEPDIADLIRLYLERAGYRVLVAHNAGDALREAQAEKPDLITLDVMLPDADGFTALEWLKSDPSTRDIPVVMISIMPDDGHGKLLGAVDYLVKPVPEQLLINRVQEILTGNGSRLVLVADDDADTRNLLAGQLIRAGYQVIEAADGQEVLSAVKGQHPGVVLLDIKMPVMDGITALRALRAKKETRDLPVIMMTASPGMLEASRSLTEVLGVSALLSKPFTAEELAMAIAQGLANRRPD